MTKIDRGTLKTILTTQSSGRGEARFLQLLIIMILVLHFAGGLPEQLPATWNYSADMTQNGTSYSVEIFNETWNYTYTNQYEEEGWQVIEYCNKTDGGGMCVKHAVRETDLNLTQLTQKVQDLEARLVKVEENCTPKILQPIINQTVIQEPEWIDWKIGTGLLAATCIIVLIASLWFIFKWGKHTGLWKELQEG